MTSDKLILDACCGGRMFWFNKQHPNALYIDARVAEKGHRPRRPNHEVRPDEVMDFRAMKFPDESFSLVVFDPPHLTNLGPNAEFRKAYGALDRNSWRTDLKAGFGECWRVLKPRGVLVFKWAETQIKLKEILATFGRTPLFGHTTGSNSQTHWLCFMKLPGEK